MMNQLFWWEITKFSEKISKFVKCLTITLLTLQMNWIFRNGERMLPITQN